MKPPHSKQYKTYEEGFSQFYRDHVTPHINKLEKRRQHYLNTLKLNSLLVILILVMLPFIGTTIESWFYNAGLWIHTQLGGTITSYSSSETPIKIIVYGVIPLSALVTAILPIFQYRFDVMHIKKIRIQMSLKELVFTQMLQFFGQFSFQIGKGISRTVLDRAKIIPDFDDYIGEDYISGHYNNMRIELAEGKILSFYRGKRVAIFSGLMVVLHTSSPRKVLRPHFKGHTLIIADNSKNLPFIREKADSYKQIHLENKRLEKRFDVLSTHPEEGKQFTSDAFLGTLIKLSELIHNTNQQAKSIEDHISDWTNHKIAFFGSVLYSLFTLGHGRSADPTLSRRRILWDIEPFKASQHSTIYKRTHSSDLSEVKTLNEDIECSLFENKILISIPYHHNLFEPRSLFHKPVIDEDLHLMFSLMHTILELTDIVDESYITSQ